MDYPPYLLYFIKPKHPKKKEKKKGKPIGWLISQAKDYSFQITEMLACVMLFYNLS